MSLCCLFVTSCSKWSCSKSGKSTETTFLPISQKCLVAEKVCCNILSMVLHRRDMWCIISLVSYFVEILQKIATRVILWSLRWIKPKHGTKVCFKGINHPKIPSLFTVRHVIQTHMTFCLLWKRKLTLGRFWVNNKQIHWVT